MRRRRACAVAISACRRLSGPHDQSCCRFRRRRATWTAKAPTRPTPPAKYHKKLTDVPAERVDAWPAASAAPAGSWSESAAQTIAGPLAEVLAQATTANRNRLGGVANTVAVRDRGARRARQPMVFLLPDDMPARHPGTQHGVTHPGDSHTDRRRAAQIDHRIRCHGEVFGTPGFPPRLVAQSPQRKGRVHQQQFQQSGMNQLGCLATQACAARSLTHSVR